METALVLDTETTDLTNPEPVCVAYAYWAPKAIPANEMTVYFRPTKPITWGAMATHHIRPKELENCGAFVDWRLPSCDYLIGHNIAFDHRALGSPAVRLIDTLPMARLTWPDLDSHKLGAVIYFLYNGDPPWNLREAHSASFDVMLTTVVLSAICKAHDFTELAQIYAFSEDAKIPRKMPFGKYFGHPIAAVDNDYRAWYRRQADADPLILEAFQRFPYGS